MNQLSDIFQQLMDENVTAMLVNGSSKKIRDIAADNIKLAKQGLEIVEQMELDQAIEDASA